MTAPIDLECPTCKALPGRYCIGWDEAKMHHAERIDAAFRARPIGGFAALVLPESLDPQLREHLTREFGVIIRDGNRLRAALKEALDRWERIASAHWGETRGQHPVRNGHGPHRRDEKAGDGIVKQQTKRVLAVQDKGF